MTFSVSDVFLTQSFEIRPLTSGKIDEALDLCEKCVGQNLYKKSDLVNAIEDPMRFFYLVLDNDKIIGYIYFLLTDIKIIASDVKYKIDRLLSLCKNSNSVVGRIQSVGVHESYRGRGLSSKMIEFALAMFQRENVDICFVICWKIEDRVPLEGAVGLNGFEFYDLAYRIWYDHEDLFCEYCGGRCKCDAAVYYKLLKRSDEK